MVSIQIEIQTHRHTDSIATSHVQVENIDNPFTHGLARFKYAFNKLQLWNMTQYERVVYFDADNVVTNIAKMEELFQCGHFCVVYMNPCHFHTGLLVVKPDEAVMKRMVQALAETGLHLCFGESDAIVVVFSVSRSTPCGIIRATAIKLTRTHKHIYVYMSRHMHHLQTTTLPSTDAGSYDGADQGFLSKYFEACDEAPMFNPKRGPSNAPLNQLHISYNMQTFYQWATGSFEPYRCGPFADIAGLPVGSIGYPVPTMIKPWYWWVGFVGHAHEWSEVRATLDEPEWLPVTLVILACTALLYVLGGRGILRLTASPAPVHAVHSAIARLGSKTSALVVCLLCLVVANRIAMTVIPNTVRPLHGIVMYCGLHYVLLTLLARLALHYVYRAADQRSVTLWDFHVSIVFFFLLFVSRTLDHIIMPVLGGGVHVPVVRALLVWPALILTQINVFFHLAQGSPIFQK
jgi:hypothetical protein